MIKYIKDRNNYSKEAAYTDKQMIELGERILSYHSKNTIDYYKEYKTDRAKNMKSDVLANQNVVLEELALYKALKKYRLEKSRVDNIKPYFIFTNAQLEEIVVKEPATLEELEGVSGFGKVKCEKYGEAILEVIQRIKKEELGMK